VRVRLPVRVTVGVLLAALLATTWAGAIGGRPTDLAAGHAADTTDAPDPAACRGEVVRLVDDLQAVVEGYEDLTAQQYVSGEQPGGAIDAIARFEESRRTLTTLGCDQWWLQEGTAGELRRLRAHNPIAVAFADQLRATLVGVPLPAEEEIVLAPGDDVATAVVVAPAGSTVRLAPGEYRVDEPVLVVQPLTIVGAGANRTLVTSYAGDIAVFAGETSELVLMDLTLTLAVEGSVGLFLEAPSYGVRGVHVTGGRATGDGGGSGIVVGTQGVTPQAARADGPPGRRIEDTEVSGNEGGGIVVQGGAIPELRRLVLRDNGACGVCYLGPDGGELVESRLTGNEIGVWLTASARPSIGSNQLTGPGQAGFVYTATATGRASGNEVRGYPIGVEIRDQAAPELDDNLLEDNEEVALVFRGEATGRTNGNVCRSGGYGIALLDRAAPELGADTCELVDERSP
jgi:hypothetical protein